MKPLNFRNNDCVPWMIRISPLFFLLLFMSENSSSQGYPSANRFYANNVEPVTYLRLNEVNWHASRHFRDHFLSNGHEKWIRENGLYIASFNDAKSINKVYYNSQGFFEYAAKYYGADGLNKELKSAILKKFDGYYIKTVTETSDLEKEIFYIKIVSPSNIKTLQCLDGNIEVTEDYINGGI
jgi:hypothetical protein